jgi:Fur family ferric uptake transcriptional regulator
MRNEQRTDIKEVAKRKFMDYLTAHKCRKTAERFAVLDVIYSDSRHFDTDMLLETLQKIGFPVSRATLYNTVQLLLDSKLIVKHHFEENRAFYERAGGDFHLHLVCTNCHSVTEHTDAELQRAILSKKIKKFKPAHYVLNVSGLCAECALQLKKNKKKK